MQERLQKYLARCGVASRRRAEALISQGRISVNGNTITKLGTKVDSERDTVALDGKVVGPPDALTYLALHKPAGFLTTRDDPHGRPTVYDVLPAAYARLAPVGRLDGRSEGLLFFSNDGGWANRVTHPRYGGEKEYAVLVNGNLTSQQLATLRAPMVLDGYRLNPVTVRIIDREDGDTWTAMTLTEGRKRQIRHMLAVIGKQAMRLVRTRIGPVGLENLAPGKVRPLTEAEVGHWQKPPERPQPEDVEARPIHSQRNVESTASPGVGDTDTALAGSAAEARRRDNE